MGAAIAIKVENLSRSFKIACKSAGVGGALKALVAPKYQELVAVQNVSFSISAGERVAFIGPNGAGKSTTIKMLTGILYPSSGMAEVLGAVPWLERSKLSYQVGTVFGQRSQLWYHLPASDSFDLFARVYGIEPGEYRQRRRELVDRFEIGGLIDKPVRQLSLGERMRCEIAASLLHRPRVLLLDEPSIGLDVSAKAIIRDLIKRESEQDDVTLLLTSHDTGDMEQVCQRVLMINHGQVLLDVPIWRLRKKYIKRKYVSVKLAEESLQLSIPGVTVMVPRPYELTLVVETEICPIERVIQELMRNARIRDVTIEDPPLEEIIKQLYSSLERDNC
jgi:ABC-2 type transport system ATP-binding protein